MKTIKDEDLGIDLNDFDAQAEIDKFKGCIAPGWKILIRLYTEPKQTKGGIILTDNTHDEQQYKNRVGLVVKIGPDVYKDDRYKSFWCKVGDWVVIPRHSGTRYTYKGMPVFCLNEDSVDFIVDNPSDITQ